MDQIYCRSCFASLRTAYISDRAVWNFSFEICIEQNACSSYGRYIGNQFFPDRADDFFRMEFYDSENGVDCRFLMVCFTGIFSSACQTGSCNQRKFRGVLPGLSGT